MKKRVVIIGGGSGSSLSIRAMKQFLDAYDISAIIAMSDSGSASGKLKRELGVLPPGDILRGLIAMSAYDYTIMRRIFYETRYSKKGKLQGFGLGHLFLALVEQYNGGLIDAIRALAQALDVVGPVFPVTLESIDLCVDLENGDSVVGEGIIDRPEGKYDSKIKHAYLKPRSIMYERAYREIVEADVIIMGPGSLYCSIIAALLPEGMSEAIEKSFAQLIYVAGNAYEIQGEIGPETLAERIETLEMYLPRPLDTIVYNNHTLSQKEKEQYTEKGWEPLDVKKKDMKDSRVIMKDFERVNRIGLDYKKLGVILHNTILD